jgi:signal transduction histidine kinase
MFAVTWFTWQRIHRPRLLRALLGTAAWLVCQAEQAGPGQDPEPAPPGGRVLTNLTELWTLPREQKSLPQRIRTEVVIYYDDLEWNIAWGECEGTATFLPLGDSPTPLKAGQRVLVDGVILPQQQRFVWDKTRLQVLADGVARQPLPIESLSDNPTGLKARLVSVEGLIDTWKIARTHFSLNFLVDGTTATAYVLNNSNGAPARFKPGDFVRINCVYAPQLDKDSRLDNLDLWVAQPEDIQVIGSLMSDPRFARPVTPIENIQDDLPPNELVCVAGVVRKHEPGRSVTLWDGTGQIQVDSRQLQPLRLGDRVEAIGYPSVLGVQQTLRNALYRLADPTNRPPPAVQAPGETPLRLAEQIRDLSHDEAARHLPVNLRAVVIWSSSDAPFAYVQDASGGIRVVNPQWDAPDTTKPGTVVVLQGVTCKGHFVPAVTNAVLRRVGWWNLNGEKGSLLSLEQAMTGAEDGRWVEMRGYVQEVTSSGRLRQIKLTTTSGEFEAWVPSSRTLKSLEGAIVRLQGICTATANARHQLTGIRIWVPESKFILTEEPKADDLFAVPLRPLDSLRRFNLQSALDRRVRTSGTVVMHVPGRYLYVQDGADAIFALSRQKDPLRPGDRVEVVGFPGNEGRRFVLREAVYRRVASGVQPKPMAVSAAQPVNPDYEGLLARTEGVLLNTQTRGGEARLLLQAKDAAFEARLEVTEALSMERLQALQPGSRVAVTGVYEVQSDEYGKPRSSLLHLRSWDDLDLLQRPSWWTLTRLLWALSGVIVVSVIAVGWGGVVAHKNKLLRQAQADLQAANDQLEHRVAERTRELQEQVAARERARTELAEAQESLVLTSHRAGMAEVATGVLHNVGNVLNSINISASVLSERLRHSAVESVSKAAALLQKPQDELARFLTEDTRGKALPGYLQRLGEVLIDDNREMQEEVTALARNVEHIKTIVSMQQSYARVGGVLEELDPKDLVEDALQINNASLGRHSIQLLRDYRPAPRVLVDRHKVLQILVNLVSNARHALNEKEADRRAVLSIRTAGPDRVRISVTDNGIGIAPENLKRIFSQGFTTRKDGHGFGLHSGAIAARELGGSLTVHSDGVGKGASFTLELPTAGPTAHLPADGPASASSPNQLAGGRVS